MSFKVERRAEAEAVRILVHGELDMATGPRVDEAVRAAAREARRVVLDLSQVTFFDSTGLQVVLDADVRARTDGYTFAVAPGDGEPLRVMRLAEVIGRLTVEDAHP